MGLFNNLFPAIFAPNRRRRGVIMVTMLSLSTGQASLPANALQATALAQINGVPAGSWPTLSPDDGRFAIAGDPVTGFSIVRGAAAVSAGAVNLAISAPGAQTATLGVTVTPAWDPSMMSPPPQRAWDVRTGATVVTNIAMSLAGAYGTSTGMTLNGSPTYMGGGGPQPVGGVATDILQLVSGSTQWGGFTALNMSSPVTDMEAWTVLCPRGGTMCVFGNGSTGGSTVILNSSRDSITARTASGTNVTIALPFTLSLGAMYVLRCRYVASTGALTVYVNGIQGATGTVNTTGFTISALGRTGGNYSNLYFGAMLLFSNLVSDSDAALLLGYLSAFISSTYYVAVAGSNSALGWNQAGAWATVDQFVTAAPTQGPAQLTLAPKGGDLWRRTTLFQVPANTNFDGGLWGTGYAEFRWSLSPTNWTLASGTAGTPGCVYSRAEATHPYTGPGSSTRGYIYDTGLTDAPTLSSIAPTPANYAAWHRQMNVFCAANPRGQRLVDGGLGAAPVAGSYGYASGTIYVALADGGNPNGRIELPYRGSAAATVPVFGFAVQVPYDNCRLSRLRFRYADGAMVSLGGTTKSVTDRLDVAYAQSDGIDGVSSGIKLNYDCRVMYVGNGAPDGSDGDGYSNHGNRNNRYRCYSGYADRGSYDDVETSSADNYSCAGFGQRPIMSPGNGTTDAARGVQNFWNYIGVLPDGQTFPNAIHNRGTFLNIYGGTFFGVGSATGKIAVRNEVRTGGGNTTPATMIRDAIFVGFAQFNQKSGGTVDEDYNAIVGATYGDGGPIGTHSISGTPKFTNAAAFDFSPTAGSPCKSAGQVVAGLLLDYAGAIRPSPPTIGAIEAA